MENPYLQNGDLQLKTELRRVEALKEPNRSYALQFKTWMGMQNRTTRTIAKRLDEVIFILNALGSQDAKTATKEDIEGLITAINAAKRRDGEPVAMISKGKLKLTLRKFYKFLLGTKGYPSIVEDVKPDRAKNSLLPADMLNEQDIEALIGQCRNPRDKAIISLLWSGMRVGELLALKVQDAKIEGGEVDVVVAGKSGQRSVSLMNPTYLVEYMHQMRNKARPSSPLFVRLMNGIPTDEWLSYASLKKVLYDLKARVPELKDRRIYPHLFRHSFASFLASQNFNPEVMRKYFGWASNDMATIYCHLNDTATKNAIRALGKRKVKPLEPKLIPKICWRCGYENTPDTDLCKKCFIGLDKDAVLSNSIGKSQKNETIEQIKKELEAVRADFKFFLESQGIQSVRDAKKVMKV